MTVENIKRIISNTDFWAYGLRADYGIKYNVGDVANNSHQLFQDPDIDENGELIYPYMEEGIYSGFYDAGELDGTCAVRFDPDDDSSIAKAMEQIADYCGDYIHVIAGNHSEIGNDPNEIIIENAQVLGVFNK